MPIRHLLLPLFVGLTAGAMLAVGPSCGKTAVCGPSTCASGCCASDGRCIGSPDNARTVSCGKGGAACADCGSKSCTDFACTGGGTGGGTGGVCGPDNCTGCCSGVTAASVCITSPSATNCGAKGSVCVSCGAGQACLSGGCGASDGGAGQVGTACAGDGDCAALGANHRCKKKTSSGGADYASGYCTRDCAKDSDCPASALCLTAAGYGEADLVCWAQCASSDECRQGYDCYAVGFGDSACWLSPLPAFDAGPPADKVGQACSSDVACQSPPDDGACLFDTLPDAGPSAFVGGYCTAPCEDSTHCSADGGAKCLAVGTFGACLQTCAAPLQGQSTCRSGYVCRAIKTADGGVLGEGFCWPRCNNPGASCGAGTCQASGYCG